MKTNLIKRIITIAATVSVTLVIGAGNVFAQGGVNWTVTIKNPTPWDAKVSVWYPLNQYTTVDIAPGGTGKVQLGANCPMGLGGGFAKYGEFYVLEPTDMNGTWYGSSTDGLPMCWNHKMRICSKPGKEGKLGKGFYAFCKD